MYRYRYINKHSQFDETSYSLILSDSDGIMPEKRIEKIFRIDERLIDTEFLYEEAKKEILIALSEYVPPVQDEQVVEE